MQIQVKVVPGAKRNQLDLVSQGVWKARVTAPALEGKANLALIDLLAEQFSVRKRQITIIKGLQSRLKTVNITD